MFIVRRDKARCADTYKNLPGTSANFFSSNSSLAEQSNKILSGLKVSAAHMNQFTLIWRIRWMLHCMNKAQTQVWRRR